VKPFIEKHVKQTSYKTEKERNCHLIIEPV